MKKILYLLLGSFFFAGVAYAAPSVIYQTTILPNSNNAYDLGTTTGKSSSGVWRNIYAQNASTSALTISGVSGSTQCLQVNSNGTVSGSGAGCGGSGSAFPFTSTTNYGVTVNSTSTPIWFTAGLMASTTSYLTYASTTALTITGTASTTNLNVSGVPSALLATNASGVVAAYAGTSCTNQFVRSLSALGAATCATVSSGDVSLANLTATDASLTFSGTYNGSTARTIGLNVGNANNWTALQTFLNASSTLFSVNNKAYFGGTSTTTIGSDGSITAPSAAQNTLPYATTTAISASGAAYVPNLASCPAGATSGFSSVCLDSTAQQVQVSTSTVANGYPAVLPTLYYGSVSYGTTTAFTGTTTPAVGLGVAGANQVWKYAWCWTDTGTVQVSFLNGTNRMTWINASTTIGTTTLATNNQVSQGTKRSVEFGTPASTPTNVSCTVAWYYVPN